MSYFSTKKIAIAGIVASLYVLLSLITLPFSGSFLQIRISEGLAVLPLLIPESVLGITAGCVISNVICGCTVYDVIFGSLITLIAGLISCVIGKTVKGDGVKFLIGNIAPVLLNAFLLPVIWYFAYGKLEYVYILQVAFLLLSQTVSVYGVGIIVYGSCKKILKSKKPLNK